MVREMWYYIYIVLLIILIVSATGIVVWTRTKNRSHEGFAMGSIVRKPCIVYTVPQSLKRACDEGFFTNTPGQLSEMYEDIEDRLKNKHVKGTRKTELEERKDDIKGALDHYRDYPVCKFQFDEKDVLQYAEDADPPDLISDPDVKGAPEDWAFCFMKPGVNIAPLVDHKVVKISDRVIALKRQDGSVDPEEYTRFAFKTFEGSNMARGVCEMYPGRFENHTSIRYPLLVRDVDKERWYFANSKQEEIKDGEYSDTLVQWLAQWYQERMIEMGESIKIVRKPDVIKLRVLNLRRTPCGVDIQPLPEEILVNSRIGPEDGVVVGSIHKSSADVYGTDSRSKKRIRAELVTEISKLDDRIRYLANTRDINAQRIDAIQRQLRGYEKGSYVQLGKAMLGLGMFRTRDLEQAGFKKGDVTVTIPESYLLIYYPQDNFQGQGTIMKPGSLFPRGTGIGIGSAIVGRMVEGKFDGERYMAANKDLSSSDNAIFHYAKFGIQEGRYAYLKGYKGSGIWIDNGYLAIHDDVRMTWRRPPWLHFKMYGWKENRSIVLFVMQNPETERIRELQEILFKRMLRRNALDDRHGQLTMKRQDLLGRIHAIDNTLEGWAKTFSDEVLKVLRVHTGKRNLDRLASFDGRCYFQMMLE